ncbi:hypothetical protein JXL83_06285, partial [candidate division WOR-3 bacterium]|nr:hypothetical protein [candidate division WOR-3 bacterium]
VEIFTAGTDVSLRIFDLSGRTIRTLAVNRSLSENAQFEWDGNDDFGSEVSSGIYRVELSSPDYTDSKLLIKIQ